MEGAPVRSSARAPRDVGWADESWEIILQQSINPTPPAVAAGAVWVMLALGRRWRPEPGGSIGSSGSSGRSGRLTRW